MYVINELIGGFILINLMQNKKTVDEFVSDLKYDMEGDQSEGS